MNLYDLNLNEIFTIKSVPQNDLLESLGIREGLEISVVTKQNFGGPVVVKLRNRNIAIDKNIAKQILMKGHS